MKKLFGSSVAVLAIACVWAGMASASMVITNGTITLGVDDDGQLNIPGPLSPTGTPFVGLRHNVTGNEATSHGCLCEGWGVGIGETLESGKADNAAGVTVANVSFASDGVTATSVSSMAGKLEVTHAFTPSASANLYSVVVTITNTSGADISDLRYTRAMDWDIEPTQFSEFTTIGGLPATAVLLASNSEPFGDPDPFAARFGGSTGNFTDVGPFDHGAVFDFGFGALLDGASKSFEIFYGAAGSEAAAFAALGVVGAEVYSFGNANCGGLPCDETFIFAFKGVGGDPIPPIPLPGAAWLLVGGLVSLGAFGAKRRTAKV